MIHIVPLNGHKLSIRVISITGIHTDQIRRSSVLELSAQILHIEYLASPSALHLHWIELLLEAFHLVRTLTMISIQHRVLRSHRIEIGLKQRMRDQVRSSPSLATMAEL